MSVPTYLQEQLIKTLLYKPENLRLIFSQTTNPAYCSNYFFKLIPVRTGIELDITNITESIRGYLLKGISLPCFVLNVSNSTKDTNSELRISPFTYRTFSLLKRVLDKLIYNDVRPSCNGGFHCHIDIKQYLSPGRTNNSIIRNRVFKYLNYILCVTKQSTRGITKTNRTEKLLDNIIVDRNHPTIEYRVFDSTLNYTDIVKRVILLQQITRSVVLNKPLDKQLCDNIMRY